MENQDNYEETRYICDTSSCNHVHHRQVRLCNERYIMEDYIDYIMDELHQEGLELGLEGQELNDYIENQFEQRGYY